ncbi:MAG TPA: patatin-like phospholipase family protein [Beijerinckiaceae bacterium]|nr:patatin-like phospholipase family protein [Beijerinckiaceae bacterium]
MLTAIRKPKVGIALGAGAARGWSHIGVLNELVENGFTPDIVAGASIGAVVGGCFAAGKLAELEAFARSMTRRRVFSLMDISFSGKCLIGGARLRNLLRGQLGDLRLEQTPIRFAAVATEVGLGHEIWLSSGDMVDALCASYSLPGIFEPVKIGGRWLFDGALVNPVPVTICRALGADVVIAVNLVSDTMFRGTIIRDAGRERGSDAPEPMTLETADERPRSFSSRLQIFKRKPRRIVAPGFARTMVDAFNIAQDRIARSRLAGDPPDVLVNARLGRIGLFDFNRAEELIAFGREAVRHVLPELTALLEDLTVA